MMLRRGLVIAVVAAVLPTWAAAGNLVPPADGTARLRPGLAAGLGVSYVNPYDVVDYIGGLTRSRVPDFSSAAEFFATAGLPLSDDWIVAGEYAYLLGGFSGASAGGGEFTIRIHMPTLLVQYAFIREDRYNVRLGGGVGYHAGSLDVRYGTLEDTYAASGPAFKLDCEANTALGEDLFIRLGADARWEFIGELTNGGGNAAPTPLQGAAPTLHMFSVGAKLGLTWYF
jgi:hypothetical protein